MGSRLGRRVVQFANLPIKLLMPSTFTNIQEIALKTIPSASKIEIKRVLESLYGFDVEKVRTLNMEGKKKKYGGILFAKPDYKKAYVTLKTPLSISQDLYPIRIIQDDKNRMNKQTKTTFVDQTDTKTHWLHDNVETPNKTRFRPNTGSNRFDRGDSPNNNRFRPNSGSNRFDRGGAAAAAAKFPWTSMRSRSSSAR
ncbi:hypothetical protein RJT34_09050 [Clitoria ternatea]|uniref:Large ribosomal subunit protein uL23m n=1 Tax=Clitoria ternatea TaxID=43366 RepID=A0AAN9K730_CLITE